MHNAMEELKDIEQSSESRDDDNNTYNTKYYYNKMVRVNEFMNNMMDSNEYNELYKQLYYDFVYQQNIIMSNNKYYLILYLIKNGFNVEYIDDNNEFEISINKKELKEMYNDEHEEFLNRLIEKEFSAYKDTEKEYYKKIYKRMKLFGMELKKHKEYFKDVNITDDLRFNKLINFIKYIQSDSRCKMNMKQFEIDMKDYDLKASKNDINKLMVLRDLSSELDLTLDNISILQHKEKLDKTIEINEETKVKVFKFFRITDKVKRNMDKNEFIEWYKFTCNQYRTLLVQLYSKL